MNVNLPHNWESPEQQEILDGLPALIFLERAGRIVFANAEARQLLGCGNEKWVPGPVEEVLWGLFPGTAEPQTALLGGRGSSPFHASLATRSGRLLPIEGTYCAASGELRDAVIVAQPVGRERTPRPQLMEDVLASIPEAVVIVRGSRVLYTNAAFTRMFGYTAEEAGGRELSHLIVPRTRLHEHVAMESAREDYGRAFLETVCTTKDAQLVDVAMQIAPLLVGGERAGHVITYRDIGERKQVAARQQHGAMHDVLTGLPNRQFELWYEPIFRLETGELDSFESILRFRDADGSIDTFDDLLPTAEETGLSISIGRKALETVCRQLHDWSKAMPGNTLALTLNMTHRQFFHEDMTAHLEKTLAATQADPARLVLEIPEAAVNERPDSALTIVQRIADCGVRVALDHFGSGTAAFHPLVRMPVNVVKMDAQLSIAAVRTGSQLALIESVIHMGKAIGLRLAAQGIETQEQLDAWRRMGCELGQGRLFSEPIDAASALQIAIEGQRSSLPGA